MIGALFSFGGAENLIAFRLGSAESSAFIPVALISGAALVTALYLSTNLAYLSQLPLLGDPRATTDFARGISVRSQDGLPQQRCRSYGESQGRR
jgi:hypothetical protein